MNRLLTNANDFVVDTIGHCFNCLTELDAQLTQLQAETDSSVPSPTQSLLHLSRYLKIQMKKVFHENVSDSIPKHLLDQVERSTLKVSLCEECAKWNAKLSELLQQLEKIEVEAASYLGLLNRKALEADENGRCNMFRKLDENKSMDGFTKKLKLEVAEAIRGETMQKSSFKLSTVQPTIKMENMTRKKILSRTRARSKLNSRRKNQKRHYGPPEGLGVDDQIKSECQNERSNDYSENFDHHEEQSEDFEQPHFPEEMENGFATNSTNDPTEYREYRSKSVQSSKLHKHMRKLDTGKYGCDLCSKELASMGAFYNHYQGTHGKTRFQCGICSKIFTLKGNLIAHQRRAHSNK